MAFIKTWTTSVNQAPQSAASLTTVSQSFVVQLIAFLVANGWTMVQYTNGTGAVVTGSEVPTLANVIWAAAGTNHSWFVLVSPVGMVPGPNGLGTGAQSQTWFVIDCNSAAVNTLSFSFHNTLPAYGTATAAPYTPNQNLYAAQQFIAAAFTLTFPFFHFLANSQGGFMAMVTLNGSGYVPFLLGHLLTVGSPVLAASGLAYPYPVVQFCSYIAASGGVFGFDAIAIIQTSNIADTVTNNIGHFIASYNVWVATAGNPTLPSNYNAFKGWNSDGTSASILPQYVGSFINYQFTENWGQNFSSPAVQTQIAGAGMPLVGDSAAADYFSTPVFCYSVTAGKTAYLGSIADISVSMQPCTANTLNTAIPTSIYVGQSAYTGGAWLPGNTSLFM